MPQQTGRCAVDETPEVGRTQKNMAEKVTSLAHSSLADKATSSMHNYMAERVTSSVHSNTAGKITIQAWDTNGPLVCR